MSLRRNVILKNNDEKQNALFFQRLFAFIIDVIIISILSSLLSYPFYDSSSVQKLNDNSNEIMQKYIDQEINIKTYVSESIDISYEMARKNGVVSLISLFLSVLYFICFQFYKNGQTIGKNIMKIKVVSNDDQSLNINNYIFRSLIIDSIFVDMIVLCFVIFANREVYFYGVGMIEFIQYMVILISAFMVMFRKDSRGLHDLVANTKVIRTDSVKELEVCEN